MGDEAQLEAENRVLRELAEAQRAVEAARQAVEWTFTPFLRSLLEGLTKGLRRKSSEVAADAFEPVMKGTLTKMGALREWVDGSPRGYFHDTATLAFLDWRRRFLREPPLTDEPDDRGASDGQEEARQERATRRVEALCRADPSLGRLVILHRMGLEYGALYQVTEVLGLSELALLAFLKTQRAHGVEALNALARATPPTPARALFCKQASVRYVEGLKRLVALSKLSGTEL